MPSFTTPLCQFLLIPTIAAQRIETVFLGLDLRVKLSAAALADDFPHCQIRFFAGNFLLIPVFKRVLIVVFPFAVPYHISFSLSKTWGKIYSPHVKHVYAVFCSFSGDAGSCFVFRKAFFRSPCRLICAAYRQSSQQYLTLFRVVVKVLPQCSQMISRLRSFAASCR